jgi:hypothetical protein
MQAMENNSLSSRNKIIMLLIAIAFLIINTILILNFFNTDFFVTTDKNYWATRPFLIGLGISFASFFLILIFLKHLTSSRLFIIFVITQISLFAFFTLLDYKVDIDINLFGIIPAEHVLAGDLFTPYTNYIADQWRILPPMWIWWYTYNYWVYGLDPIIWRFVNVLLQIGIAYVMVRIFQENRDTEKGLKEEYFKIGLSFYMCSIIPIWAIVMNANIIAFPMLLGLLGVLFYFRSKKDPNNLYISILFFSLCALTELFSAVWILAILLVIIFQKDFRRFIILGIEIIVIFCIVCAPLLINDALGFLRRLFWQMLVYEHNFDGTIWVFPNELLSYLPALLAVGLCAFYIYQNYKEDITIDFFIVVISIFMFFSPAFGPWHYLWFFPIVSINLIYSFRKYMIANLLFLGWFVTFLLIWAIGEITIVGMGSFDPGGPLYIHIMVFQLLGQTLGQMGCLYLVHSYTKSKILLFVMLIPFIVVYILNIFWWLYILNQ